MGVFHEILGDATKNDYAVGEPGRPEPTIEPGEIWLVECDPAGLSPAHAGLLRQANVVLYERALAAALAEALPTGLYAEKLPADRSGGAGRSRRARGTSPPTAGACCN